MKTSEEVVAEIIVDIPELKSHEAEFVDFMDKVQKLNVKMMKAKGYYERREIANRITFLAQGISRNSNGEGRAIRNEALNRIFDHIEGVVGDD